MSKSHPGCDATCPNYCDDETVSELRDLIEHVHAEMAVWIMRPVSTIFKGLEQGIATVPNSLPHGHLKEAMPRWERLEAKMKQAFAQAAESSLEKKP
jgi:hypothetical protein